MSFLKEYSGYYNLLYKDKDYPNEVAYIDKLIRSLNHGPCTLLDIGCGTGMHANLMAEKGYKVHGIDLSEPMIEIAKRNFGKKISFGVGDIRNFDLSASFDVIVSLFHVMSYQVTNEDINNTFQSVYNHLNPGGLFIFDCWYGPGVMNDPPSVKIKRMSDEETEIIRIAEPVSHFDSSRIDVNFHILINDLKTNRLTQFRELHPMRFLFKNEIELFADKYLFKVVGCYSWLNFTEPTRKDWYATFVLTK